MDDLAELVQRVERALPADVLRDLRQEGYSLTLGSSAGLSYPVVRVDPALAEEEVAQLEAMAAFGPEDTGVSNTIYISPDATGRHAARIKVAIDRPLTFSVRGKQASITVHDGEHIAGAPLSAALHKQLREFIELNRDVIMHYWRGEIGTPELVKRLRRI